MTKLLHADWYNCFMNFGIVQRRINFRLTGGVQIFLGGTLVCHQGADRTLFIFSHSCRL